MTPYHSFHNAVLYTGITGHALADPAMRGHGPAPATDRLTTAITGNTSNYVRFRMMCQIKLASLTIATGDPIEAATLDTAALDTAGAIRSRQVINVLRQLVRHAARYSGVGKVDELHHRITTAVLESFSKSLSFGNPGVGH